MPLCGPKIRIKDIVFLYCIRRNALHVRVVFNNKFQGTVILETSQLPLVLEGQCLITAHSMKSFCIRTHFPLCHLQVHNTKTLKLMPKC